MNELQVKQIFSRVTLEEIMSTEKTIGYSFPNDYREFILLYNGGFLKPNVFLINEIQSESIIDVFFGIGKAGQLKHLDLNENIRNNINYIPNGIIPIGRDPGGNLICLNINKNVSNDVYFFDHEIPNLKDNKITNENLYLIADSFTAFLEKLH